MHCRDIDPHGRSRHSLDSPRNASTAVTRRTGFQENFVMRLIRPHPEYPVLSAETHTADGAKNAAAVAESTSKHVDYDLRPLRVDSLAHYIDTVADNDRFRVH
jgi:hypothetical protein